MNQLLPYETIVKASEGDPEAVAAVLSHYAGYIRSCAKMDGQINTSQSRMKSGKFRRHSKMIYPPCQESISFPRKGSI